MACQEVRARREGSGRLGTPLGVPSGCRSRLQPQSLRPEGQAEMELARAEEVVDGEVQALTLEETRTHGS